MSLQDALFGADEDAELDAEIRAELDHHLALAAERLHEQGLAPDAAEHEAERRFGDYDNVRRACLRANLRGTLMLRKLHVATTVILLVTVVSLLGANYVQAGRLRAKANRAHAALESALAARERPGVVILEVGDRVTFVPSYNPELSVTEKVALDGQLLVPAAGWIDVVGLSREEAERQVTEALKPYYVQVDVKLKIER